MNAAANVAESPASNTMIGNDLLRGSTSVGSPNRRTT